MLRAPEAQTIFFVGSIVAAIAAIGAISLLSAALLEGRAVTVVEDITLDVVIGCLVVIGPAGLLLWQQLRQRDRFQETLRLEKRKLAYWIFAEA